MERLKHKLTQCLTHIVRMENTYFEKRVQVYSNNITSKKSIRRTSRRAVPMGAEQHP